MLIIRRAEPGDLDSVAAIQDACPEAAHWPATDYLAHEFLVAISDGIVAGFVVWRNLTAGESEILNLAVTLACRRRGIARRLLEALLRSADSEIFLEVRESNRGARNFYKSMGFQEVNMRPEYYESPPEAAIVMKFHSC